MNEKSLALSSNLKKELAALSDEERAEVIKALQEDLRANLEYEEPEFPLISVLHSAALFEFPDGKRLEKFTGTIIEILPARAWWKEAIGKDRVPPTCFSRDWLRPDPEADEPQAETCKECKWNKWGTATDAEGVATRGKACRMRKRIFISLPGHEIPYVLSASPMSLKPLRDYLVYLSDKKLQKNRVETEFSLERQESGAQVFSTLSFEVKRELSLKEYLDARAKRESYLGKMKGVPVQPEEFEVAESHPETVETQEVTADNQKTESGNEIPF